MEALGKSVKQSLSEYQSRNPLLVNCSKYDKTFKGILARKSLEQK